MPDPNDDRQIHENFNSENLIPDDLPDPAHRSYSDFEIMLVEDSLPGVFQAVRKIDSWRDAFELSRTLVERMLAEDELQDSALVLGGLQQIAMASIADLELRKSDPERSSRLDKPLSDHILAELDLREEDPRAQFARIALKTLLKFKPYESEKIQEGNWEISPDAPTVLNVFMNHPVLEMIVRIPTPDPSNEKAVIPEVFEVVQNACRLSYEAGEAVALPIFEDLASLMREPNVVENAFIGCITTTRPALWPVAFEQLEIAVHRKHPVTASNFGTILSMFAKTRDPGLIQDIRVQLRSIADRLSINHEDRDPLGWMNVQTVLGLTPNERREIEKRHQKSLQAESRDLQVKQACFLLAEGAFLVVMPNLASNLSKACAEVMHFSPPRIKVAICGLARKYCEATLDEYARANQTKEMPTFNLADTLVENGFFEGLLRLMKDSEPNLIAAVRESSIEILTKCTVCNDAIDQYLFHVAHRSDIYSVSRAGLEQVGLNAGDADSKLASEFIVRAHALLSHQNQMNYDHLTMENVENVLLFTTHLIKYASAWIEKEPLQDLRSYCANLRTELKRKDAIVSSLQVGDTTLETVTEAIRAIDARNRKQKNYTPS